MEVLVIGGVAAGTKAAAKFKRENPAAKVTLITRSKDISYAGCALPYYIGGVIEQASSLIIKTPAAFAALTGVEVRTNTEAASILPGEKQLEVADLATGTRELLRYDKLVIAAGAEPFVPELPGRDLKNVHTLRTPDDAIAIRKALETGGVKRAVIVGGGFIGLEVAENLKERGVKTTIVEMAPQILPGFDEEMAYIGEDYLLRRDVMVLCGERVAALEGAERVEKVVTDRRKIKADLVILSIGVKPNAELAKRAGLKLGARGAIAVNAQMQTSDPDIYAVGDCAETCNLLTGAPGWTPLGSTANKAGRVAALHMAGEADALPGVLGTGIVKLFGFQAARTGLTEDAARKAGYDAVSVIVPANDRAHYYPGAKNVITKLVADRRDRRILGAQIVGEGAADKPIDILATAITFRAKAEDLERLDLAYAPPFSMAMSSTIVAANVLRNKLAGKMETIAPTEFWQHKDEYTLVDVRPPAEYEQDHLPGAVNLPVDQIDAARASRIDPAAQVVLICKIGKNSYLAYNKLRALGFDNCRVLEGGLAIPRRE